MGKNARTNNANMELVLCDYMVKMKNIFGVRGFKIKIFITEQHSGLQKCTIFMSLIFSYLKKKDESFVFTIINPGYIWSGCTDGTTQNRTVFAVQCGYVLGRIFHNRCGCCEN